MKQLLRTSGSRKGKTSVRVRVHGRVCVCVCARARVRTGVRHLESALKIHEQSYGILTARSDVCFVQLGTPVMLKKMKIKGQNVTF